MKFEEDCWEFVEHGLNSIEEHSYISTYRHKYFASKI